MDAIVLDSERRLRVSQAEARVVLVRFLRSQEFTLTAEQVSMVSAKRGSAIAGSVQSRKLPVVLRASFTPADDGCTVSIHLGDAWRSGVGKVWGMNGPYRSMMGEIQTALDQVLSPLAALDSPFETAVAVTSTRDIPLVSNANAGVVKGGAAVAGTIDALLTPADRHSTPKQLKEVVLRCSQGTASFDRMAVEGLFTVGLLVSTKPGSMPANLARDVEALSAKLEACVAEQPQGRVVCEIDEREVPVVEFLAKQAAIRESLPLRTLHVCTTCRFEKIVNEDYEKLQEKNRRKRLLTGAVGATVSTSGISPFLLVGSLLKFKNFDIPFVCPRCQGLDADSSIVTYCPNCGERRDEVVLRSCRRCRHNFGTARDARDDGEFWGPEKVAIEPADLSPPPVLAALSACLPPPTSVPATIAAFPTPAPATASLAPPMLDVVSRPADWYPDTTGRHQYRYWDGVRWTSHASDNGIPSHDPL